MEIMKKNPNKTKCGQKESVSYGVEDFAVGFQF